MVFTRAPLFVRLLQTVVVFDCFSNIFAREIHRKSTHRPHLIPRFLNGNYIAWPNRYPCIPVDCPTDTPPPDIYYKPNNLVFTRMQMAGDRAFVITPRYKPGIPFTLGYVPLTKRGSMTNSECDMRYNSKQNGYQSISPYPSLSAHCQFTKELTKSSSKKWYCDKPGLVNVVDLYLGPDGILWVLDTGIVHTAMSDDSRIKPFKYTDPRVLGIDVVTGRTVHKIQLEKLMKPVRFDHNETMATMAQSLQTIAVEYVDKCVTRTKRHTRSSAFYGENVNDICDKYSNHRSHRPKIGPKPVAVYVSDKYKGGSILVWLVEDCRGFRVVLPESITRMTSDGEVECNDCDPGMSSEDDTMHLALLEETGTTVRNAELHLYFTFTLRPDAYKIPVSVLRNRRHRRPATESAAKIQLTGCTPAGGGENRCVTNVGRKPVGSDGRRPMVPVNSVEGLWWYFRDSAVNGGSDLYVWDSRSLFLPDNFEPVRRTGCGGVTDETTACPCDETYDGNVNRDETRHDCDDDRGASREYEDKNCAENATDRLAGFMRITSVDFAYTDPEEADCGIQDTLWAMKTNIDDWKHGRTGHFGMTALLCPISVKKFDPCRR